MECMMNTKIYGMHRLLYDNNIMYNIINFSVMVYTNNLCSFLWYG